MATDLNQPDYAVHERCASEHISEELIVCLQRQLSEVEALKSIFCLDGELSVDERNIQEIQLLCQGRKCEAQLPSVVLDIRLRTEIKGEQALLNIRLPAKYPLEKPAFTVFSSHLKEEECEKIVQRAKQLADERIEECLLECIQAAEEELQGLKDISLSLDDDLEKTAEVSRDSPTAETFDDDDDENESHCQLVVGVRDRVTEKPVLGRRLCYSHHIRNPVKRRLILEWARDLDLGGYSKIGYPGVVVVEGPEMSCQLYVNSLQRLRWKHFVIRGEQIVHAKANESIDDLRVFPRHMKEFGPDAMSELAKACREAGLEALFLTCMKIYHKPDKS